MSSRDFILALPFRLHLRKVGQESHPHSIALFPHPEGEGGVRSAIVMTVCRHAKHIDFIQRLDRGFFSALIEGHCGKSEAGETLRMRLPNISAPSGVHGRRLTTG
jgi:hypothetical protein